MSKTYNWRGRLQFDEISESLKEIKRDAADADKLLSMIGDRKHLNQIIQYFIKLDDQIKNMSQSAEDMQRILGDSLQKGFMTQLDNTFSKMSDISQKANNLFAGVGNIDLKKTGAKDKLKDAASQLNSLLSDLGIDKQIDLQLFSKKTLSEQRKEIFSFAQNLNEQFGIVVGNAEAAFRGVQDNMQKFSAETEAEIEKMEAQNKRLIDIKKKLDEVSKVAANVKSKGVSAIPDTLNIEETELTVENITKMLDEIDGLNQKITSGSLSADEYAQSLIQVAELTMKIQKAFSMIKDSPVLSDVFKNESGRNKNDAHLYNTLMKLSGGSADQYNRVIKANVADTIESIINSNAARIESIKYLDQFSGPEEQLREIFRLSVQLEELDIDSEEYDILEDKINDLKDSFIQLYKIKEDEMKTSTGLTLEDLGTDAEMAEEIISHFKQIIAMRDNVGSKTSSDSSLDISSEKIKENIALIGTLTQKLTEYKEAAHIQSFDSSASDEKLKRSQEITDEIEQNIIDLLNIDKAGEKDFLKILDPFWSDENASVIDTLQKLCDIIGIQLPDAVERGSVAMVGFGKSKDNTGTTLNTDQLKSQLEQVHELAFRTQKELSFSVTADGVKYVVESMEGVTKISEEAATAIRSINDNMTIMAHSHPGGNGYFSIADIQSAIKEREAGLNSTIMAMGQNAASVLNLDGVSDEIVKQIKAKIKGLDEDKALTPELMTELQGIFASGGFTNALKKINISDGMGELIEHLQLLGATSTSVQTPLEKLQKLISYYSGGKINVKDSALNYYWDEFTSEAKTAEQVFDAVMAKFNIKDLEGNLLQVGSSQYQPLSVAMKNIAVGDGTQVGTDTIKETIVDLQKYHALAEDISGKFGGEMLDDISIGKYQEKLRVAREELELLAKQGSFTAGELEAVEQALDIAANHLYIAQQENERRILDLQNRPMYSYSSEYSQASRENIDLRNENDELKTQNSLLEQQNTDLSEQLSLRTQIAGVNESDFEDEDAETIRKENGALEERKEILQEIAEMYGVQITQKNRNRYEELEIKDSEDGLTTREQNTFDELGDRIIEADSNLEEFEKTYERIVLKLSNGKKLEILPNDKGLRDLYKINDEYGTYNGHEIDDIQFVRKISDPAKENDKLKETNRLLEQELETKKETLAATEAARDAAEEALSNERYISDELGQRALDTEWALEREKGRANLLELQNEELREQLALKEQIVATDWKQELAQEPEYFDTTTGQLAIFEGMSGELQKAEDNAEELKDTLKEIDALEDQISFDDLTFNDNNNDGGNSSGNGIPPSPPSGNNMDGDIGDISNKVYKVHIVADDTDVAGKVQNVTKAMPKKVEDNTKLSNAILAAAKELKNAASGVTAKQVQTADFEKTRNIKLSAFNQYKDGLSKSIALTQDLQDRLDYLELDLQTLDSPDALDAWAEAFDILKKQIDNFTSIEVNKKLGEVNAIANKAKKEFETLDFKVTDQNLDPEQLKLVDLRKQLTDAVIEYQGKVKAGQQAELQGINDIIDALHKEIEAYKQQKGFIDIQTKKQNEKFGKNKMITATNHYDSIINSLKATVDNTNLDIDIGNDDFKNSKIVEKQLRDVIVAYNELKAVRERLNNQKDPITEADEQVFERAKKNYYDVAKALEKIINTVNKKKDNSFNFVDDIDVNDVKALESAMRELALTNFNNIDVSTIKFDKHLKQLFWTVDNGDGTFTEFIGSLNSAENAMVATAKSAKQATSLLDQVKGGIGKKFADIFTYMSARFGIDELFQQIRQGIQYVREIDSALTELKKVTNETDASYAQFLETMSKTSGKVGSTVADLTTMAAEWARLGYSMQEAGKLAESTAILLNVSEFDNATEASEALISTMQAFQYTADESQHVVDILNEVGNNYAVSSDGIATALKTSASALMEGGNNLEQATALVAAANRVVQDPSSVGSALRTISLRLRGTSVEILEEMGEETDGVIESTSKLQEKLKALTGVDILTDAGSYKDTYTILKEIGNEWEHISDIDKAATLELMAGKNRANTLSAILSNMKDLEGAYQSAMNAQGSALKENEAYLDSIQGHIDQFNNSLQTMWMHFVDSEAVKIFVDIGRHLIEFIDKLGLIESIVVGIVGYLTLFKKTDLSKFFGFKSIEKLGGEDLANEIDKLNQAISNGPAAFDAYRIAQQGVNNGIYQMIQNTQKAQYTIDDYVEAMRKAEMKQTLINGAIVAGVAAITWATSALEDYIASLDTLQEEYDELQSSISSLEGDIDSINTKLSSVQEQIDALSGKKLTLTEAEDLKRLKEQSAELERQKGLKEKYLKIQEEQNETKSLLMIDKLLSSTAANQAKATKEAEKSGKTWGKTLGWILGIAAVAGLTVATGGVGGASLIGAGGKAIASALLGKAGIALSLGNVFSSFGGTVGGAIGSKTGGKDYKIEDNSIIEWYESYENAIEEATNAAAAAEQNYFSEMTEENYEAWQNKVDEIETLQADMYEGLENLQEYIGNLEYNDHTASVIDSYNQLLSYIDVKSNEGNIDAQISAIQGLQSEYYQLSKGVDENGHNVALSAEEYARYLNIIEQIVAYTPSIVQGYDAQGNAILNYNSLVADSIELLKEQQRQAAKDTVSDEALTKVVKSSNSYYDNAKEDWRDRSPKNFSVRNGSVTWSMSNSSNVIEDVLGIKKGMFQSDISFVEENIDQIVKNKDEITQRLLLHLTNIGISEEDRDAYINKYIAWIDEFATTVSAASDKANQKIRETLYLTPQSSENYDNLSGSQLAFINSYIMSLEGLKDESEKGIKEIRDNILNLTDFIAENTEVQELIDSLFALDMSNMPVQKYVDEFNGIWGEIIEKVEIPKDRQEALKNQLFPDMDNVKTMQDEVVKKLTTNSSGLIKNLSLPELRIAYRYLLEEADGSLTFEEMKQKISEYSNEIDGPVVQTYSTLKQQVADYNNIVAQSAEIVLNNTEVTQEYKDALIELGVSEADLAECFDDTNDLVVKNAKKLKELVKGTKNNTAQNIKLAKSQATLQYYELFKKMRGYVNAQGIIIDNKYDEILALHQEMNVLEKVISKYSILETQLLNTTNAYSTFQQAQEADAATNYIGETEEMILALGEAFNTAELGTESAQAAIAGLVPESVYKDLDTVDEKMSAIYDYFKTGKLSMYFDIQYDDDGKIESAEMKLGNMRKFIEDGLANGVFNGEDWQHFDLSDDINNLEEFAKEMNVTKDVAFAFFKAIEDHDIEWLNGDYSSLFDKLVPTAGSIQELRNQMQREFDQTPIDLTVRPKVKAATMKEAGWDVGDDEYATVHTVSAYASEFGLTDENDNDYAINITPILPDGTVIKGGEDGLKDWIREQLASGKKIEDLDVFLGSYKTMNEATTMAEKLHEMQEDYYTAIENYSFEYDIYKSMNAISDLNAKLASGEIDAKEYVEQFKILNSELETAKKASRTNMFGEDGVNDKTPSEIDSMNIDEVDNYFDATQKVTNATNDLQTATDEYEEAVNAVKDAEEEGREATEEEVQAVQDKQKAVADATDVLGEAIEKQQEFSKPTEAEIKIVLDDIEAEIAAAGDKFDKALTENFELDENGYYVIKANLNMTDLENKYPGITQYVNLLNSRTQLTAHADTAEAETNLKTINDTLTNIQKILETVFKVKVDADGAITETNNFKSLWDSIKSKTVNLWTKIFGDNDISNNNPKEGDHDVNGTAHASGNWGLPKAEKDSLVGELGQELVVDPHSGRYYTVGDNGAEFVDLPKNAIIFNHKQTESLLSKGYVTGRGKAYAEGNAHVTIFDDGSSKDQWEGTGYSSGDDPTWNAADALETVADNLSDVSDDAKDTIDFIEIKLEEIETKISKTMAKLELVKDDASKSSINKKEDMYDELVAAEKNKSNTYYKAAQVYNEKAAQLLKDIPYKYRELAKNGAIKITDFVGENETEQAELINEYREWAQKADDAEIGYLESVAQQSAYRIEELEDIADDFENIVGAIDAESGLLESQIDLLEESGERVSSGMYEELIKNENQKKKQYQQERKALQKELNQAVKSGEIKVGTDEWYEAKSIIADVDEKIIQCEIDAENFQNAIQDLRWDNFDKLIDRLDSVDSELSHLHDRFTDGDGVIDESGNWTDKGIAAMGTLAQQMELAKAKSEEYADQIAWLNKNWKKSGYSYDEYIEKLNELKEGQWDSIEAYEDAKDSIVDLNKTRIDAVKDGMEKELDAYKELIDKQKELLSAEKDLHDFEKSIGDQEKEIATIERKIAALTGNNSASATAQRKQLEAELLEAKAELEELYYDRSIENQQNALDREYEHYEETMNDEMEALDKYLEDEEKVIADSLEIVKNNADSVLSEINEISKMYGIEISDCITQPWRDGENAISGYKGTFEESFSSFAEQIDMLIAKYEELAAAAEAAAAAESKMSFVKDKINNAFSNVKDIVANAAANFKDNSPNDSSGKSSTTLSKGTTVTVDENATNFSSKSGNAKMASYVSGGSYTVMQTSGNQVLIGKNGTATGWVDKKDLKGYASGTLGVEKDQWAWIDEVGEELVMHAGPDGKLSYLTKGSSVVPSDLTEKLMKLAVDPTQALENSRPVISAPQITNNEINIDASIAELIHIDSVTNDTLPNFEKVVEKQIDKYIKGLNAQIRKYTR